MRGRKRIGLTAEQLRATLEYDPEEGRFWRVQAGRRRIAGCRHAKGYRVISIKGVQYLEHRLAWLYVHGEWAPDELDHINGTKDDNRIANLRPASSAQNKMNVGLRSTNVSGFKGVKFLSKLGKWQARISSGGRTFHIGLFDTAEQASAAYLKRATELVGEFARTR